MVRIIGKLSILASLFFIACAVGYEVGRYHDGKVHQLIEAAALRVNYYTDSTSDTELVFK